MVDFTNTEVSFRIRTKTELRKGKLLFSAINHPLAVKGLASLSELALRFRLPLGWIIKPTLYAQFVGGETLEEADSVAKKLSMHGVSSILDYSAEGKNDDDSIELCFQEILSSIKFGDSRSYVAFAVFKPTGITKASILEKKSSGALMSAREQEEYEKFVLRIDTLCSTASQAGVPILVDAEDYCFQPAIDEIVEVMMERYNSQQVAVYNTLQMYRADRLDYLKNLHARAKEKGFLVGAKFVRGAYMEKERRRAAELGYPSPINSTKEETDQLYDDALIYSMENREGISIFAGTHNEDSVRLLVELVYKYGLEPSDKRIWFSQLYGMSDNLSFNLAAEGFNVAKYLPYGPVKEVLPYLIRRAAENSSVAGQSTRELDLINSEIKRRKYSNQW